MTLPCRLVDKHGIVRELMVQSPMPVIEEPVLELNLKSLWNMDPKAPLPLPITYRRFYLEGPGIRFLHYRERT